MKNALAYVVMLACAASIVRAADETPSIEAILRQWERASRDTPCIDATFTRLKINHTGERRKEVEDEGRFYWEAPDRAVYRVDNEVHAVWNDGLMMIDLKCRSVWSVSGNEHARAIEQLKAFEQLSFWQLFSSLGNVISGAQLSDVLPLCGAIDASEVQEAYKLTSQSHEQGILITAIPKRPSQLTGMQQVDLILDETTFTVLAHRIVKGQCEQTVHIFRYARSNAKPQDRDKLFTPDVSGFTSIYDGRAKKPAGTGGSTVCSDG